MPAPKDFGVPTNVLHQLTVTMATAGGGLLGQPVFWDGQIATASTVSAMGLLVEDATVNKPCGVAMAGLCEGLAGAAVAIGAAVGPDATGRLVPVAAGSHVLGRAVSAATAAGQKFQVYITREGTN